MSWWQILIYGSLLFAFAGLMSVTVAPLENSLFASISNKLTQSIPVYFGWKNIEYLKQYPTDILLLTCVGYFVCNVIVGPIVEDCRSSIRLLIRGGRKSGERWMSGRLDCFLMLEY